MLPRAAPGGIGPWELGRTGVGRPACSRSRMGSRKAAVLPLPVIAQARMSRPARAAGMAACWIGVASEKPRAAIPRRRSGWRSKDAKDMVGLFTFEARYAVWRGRALLSGVRGERRDC